MRVRGDIVAICPQPPTVLGARAGVCSFFAQGAWRAWSQAHRGLLAARLRDRERRRRPTA
jgi:hypothetical protein